MTAFWGPYYSDKELRSSTPPPDNEMPVEVEQSTGFHVFELHAPSAGISFFAIVLGLIAVGLAYGCYRKCCFARIFSTPPTPWHSMAAPPPVPIAPPPQPDTLQPLLQLMALQNMQSTRVPSRYPMLREPSPPRFVTIDDLPSPSAPPPVASAPAPAPKSIADRL